MLLVHCQLHPLPLGYCPSMKLLNMSRHLLLTVTVKVALSPPRPHHLCKKSYPEGLVRFLRVPTAGEGVECRCGLRPRGTKQEPAETLRVVHAAKLGDERGPEAQAPNRGC